MPPRKPIVPGTKFERWTVLRPHGKIGNYYTVWCRCDCGTEKEVRESGLTAGTTKSCGCTNRSPLTHGMAGRLDDRGTRVPEYRAWGNIVQRCTKPSNPQWKNYGGRGITICDRWRESFAAFMEDMGPKPSPDHTIDRIDNERGYEPGNCQWATKKQQCRNRRDNHLLTYQGKTMSVAAWAEETGIRDQTLRGRLRLGWSTKRTLATPVDH